MGNLIFKAEGCRGRSIEVYDTKCIIETKVTLGSILSKNVTDGIKTIFSRMLLEFSLKNQGF